MDHIEEPITVEVVKEKGKRQLLLEERFGIEAFEKIECLKTEFYRIFTEGYKIDTSTDVCFNFCVDEGSLNLIFDAKLSKIRDKKDKENICSSHIFLILYVVSNLGNFTSAYFSHQELSWVCNYIFENPSLNPPRIASAINWIKERCLLSGEKEFHLKDEIMPVKPGKKYRFRLEQIALEV